MATSGPFLMPDGSRLGQFLRDKDDNKGPANSALTRKQGKSTKRGKDLLFVHIKRQQAKLSATAADAGELAELRALESVGVRRRRRWLNDRMLRDMTGVLTVSDMHQLFSPVPFGWREPSALERIAQPAYSYLWDGFRNIDMDREAQVLQRWEAHNQQAASASSSAPAEAAAGGTATLAPASQALQRWNAVSRKSRAALRKANLHSVLALESMVLDFLDDGDTTAELVLPGLDPWGRLLLHGMAEFYGLLCASRDLPAATQLPCTGPGLPAAADAPAADPEPGWDVVSREDLPAPQPAAAAAAQVLSPPSGSASDAAGHLHDGAATAASAAGGCSAGGGQAGPHRTPFATAPPADSPRAVGPAGCQAQEATKAHAETEAVVATVLYHRPGSSRPPAGAVGPPRAAPEITLHDVLAALVQAPSGSLSARQLHAFWRTHVHGSEAALSEQSSWVVVGA